MSVPSWRAEEMERVAARGLLVSGVHSGEKTSYMEGEVISTHVSITTNHKIG